MRVVLMRIGAAWRQRTRALVTFTFLVALAGAVVLTAFAGARRTDSVTARFMRTDGTPDVIVNLSDLGTMHGVEDLRKQPEVAELGVAAIVAALPYDKPYAPLLAPTDGAFGTSTWRSIVVSGRRPDAGRADEVALSQSHATLLNARVGDRLPLIAFSQHDAETCLRNEHPPPECDRLWSTPRLSVRVVGIIRTPIDLSNRVGDVGFSTLSRGFFEQHRSDIGWNPVVMAKLHSRAETKSFVDHAHGVLGETPSEITPINGAAVLDAVDVLSTGLLLFGIVAAIAAAFAIGQTVVRHVASDESDRAALGAIGATRVDRALDAAGAIGIAGAIGALLAVGGAYLASTFMPIGVARRAEPALRPDFDSVVLTVGALVLVGFVCATAMLSASVLARRRRGSRPERRSTAARLAGAPVAPSTAVGLRNAFGASRDAVPARAAVGGIAAATAGVIAVLVFAAGLHSLAHTPAQYGWGWDAMDIHYSDQSRAALLADPDIADVALLVRRAQATVAGRPTLLLAVTPLRGSMQPTLVRGRLPQQADEIAVGNDTLDLARVGVGDRVAVRGSKGAQSMRVVGVAAFATAGDGDPLADGGVVAPAGMLALNGPFDNDNDAAGQRNFAVRFRAGVNHSDALARLAQAVGSGSDDQEAFAVPTPPAEVEKLRQVESLPFLLAAFLAVLGVLAIAHASFVGARQRAHDFAILRALGFRPRDVRRSISVEAVTLAVCGALIGIPLGVLLGRYAWNNVAEGVGVLVTQHVPAPALLLAVPAAALIALAAALVPARRAARLHPGEMLRTE